MKKRQYRKSILQPELIRKKVIDKPLTCLRRASFATLLCAQLAKIKDKIKDGPPYNYRAFIYVIPGEDC